MQRKFEPGEVYVSPEVEELLARTGQDAEFFLEKHFCGDWGEQSTALNEEGFRNRKIVVSVFRTLRGVHVWVFTNFEKNRTYIDCMRVTDSLSDPTVTYIPTQLQTNADQFTYTVSDENGGALSALPAVEVPYDTDAPDYGPGSVLVSSDTSTVIDSPQCPVKNDGFHYTPSDGHTQPISPVDIAVPPASPETGTVDDVEEPGKQS